MLTETLLRPADDEAKIADLAPPGYSVLSFPRSGAKGGGVAFVIRDSLKPRVATTSSFPVQHPCFEAAQLTLTYNKQLPNFYVYHRPPSKSTNSLTPCFSISFPTFLNTLTVCLAKHFLWMTLAFILKTKKEKKLRKMHDIIDIFNLTQSVSEPTHNQGRLLDLVFYKHSDNIFIPTKLHHGLTSDHAAFVCKLVYLYPYKNLKLSRTDAAVNKKIDTGAFKFKQDFSHAVSQTSSISDHLCSVLDKHALSAVAQHVRGSRRPGSAVSRSSSVN